MNCTIRLQSVYGRTLAYPACKTAQALAKLAGVKSFTPQQLKIIADELGYTVNIEPQTL